MDKLTVEDLHLAYGAFPILKGVSLNVRRGEILVLLGPSGSGKTTLLRAIAGLESPQRGTIRIDGKAVFDSGAGVNLPAEKRDLGLVFQSYALWPHRTAAENIGYGLKLRKVPKDDIARRVQSAMEQLGLGKLAERHPHQLSGGQQQRVAIARALVYNPPVLLLDEPLSNLDAKLRDEAKAWLRALILDLQLSAVMVTHDQTEAMAIADRVVLLNDGRLEQEGTPVGIYHDPRTLFTAEFFGSTSRLAGTVTELAGHQAKFTFAGCDMLGTPHQEVACGDAVAVVRTEKLRVVDGPGPNRIQFSLRQSMFLGDRWEYFFDRDGMQLRAYGEEQLAAGSHWIEVAPNDFWIFRSN